MTTANREKVYACDYCGSDYTDAKYCCAARREYLNAHGEFETGRAPAASVGDAPSDAVAFVDIGPDGITYETRRDTRGLRALLGEGKHPLYTAPPAAPVVSADRVELAAHAIAHFDENQYSFDHYETLARVGLQAALSVPATDDKGGETYTLAMIEEAWGDSVPLVRSRFDAFRVRLEELRRYAAPTSPHDVDAVRGLIAKWREAADRLELCGLEADSLGLKGAADFNDARARLLRENADELERLTAALRKPGDDA